MKSRTAVYAIMIAAMGLGSATYAESHLSYGQGADAQRQEQRSEQRPEHRSEQRGNRSARDGRRSGQQARQAERRDDREDFRHDRRDARRDGRTWQTENSRHWRGDDRGRHGVGGYPQVRGPIYYGGRGGHPQVRGPVYYGGRGGHPQVRGPVYYSSGARGPNFRPGAAIPRHYRSYNYVVNDWRSHRLHAPRRGQQWVQVGADYALIAIATGVIVQLILSH